MENRKAVVTGANGFVGTWLVKELASHGVKVYAVIKDENEDISAIKDIDGIEIVYCSLDAIDGLADRISEKDFDCFYHLAWVGSGGLLRADYKVQLDNAKYSCEAAYAAKEIGCRRFLCAGTVTENIVDSTLDAEMVSQNMMYGISKKTTHLMLNVYCNMIGLPFIWMQFSNIYGPYNLSGNLISYTMNELVAGRRPSFSKGTQPYDFIYIKDLVRAAFMLGFGELREKVYFIGSGSSRKLCEYLNSIPQILGEGYEVGVGERPDDGVIYHKEWFDISKLNRDTGFKAEYSFEQGIRNTFEWIKNMQKGN